MYSLRKSIGAFALMLLLFVTTSAKAATLSDEEYARLKNVFTDNKIATMTDEDAQRYLSYDLENTNKVSKYYKVTETANGTTTVEVTKSEAENASQVINNNVTRASGYATSYKNIQIMSTPLNSGNNYYYMSFVTVWLVQPRVKSYDVIAMRTDDVTIVEGSQSGTQYYTKSGNRLSVEYSHNGTNMVNQSNGFGISMNLVDAGTKFECEINAIVQATTKWATVYASYQHAVRNVTLAQSQAYNISHNGSGEVINFATAVDGYYDQMRGVSIGLEYKG